MSFDYSAVLSLYSGRDLANRLLFMSTLSTLPPTIIESCLPSIQKDTSDTALYTTIVSLHPTLYTDSEWINKTNSANNTLTTKLSVELKTFTTNLIKESIRLGHNDLGSHFYKIGEIQLASQSFLKSKSFSTTSTHLLESLMELIKISLEIKNYSNLRNFILKAESTLESIQSTSTTPSTTVNVGNNINMPGMIRSDLTPQQKLKLQETQIMGEKLGVLNGVAYLGLGQYQKSAHSFTSITAEILQATNGEKHFVPLNDIILYTVITSLATLGRKDLREKVLDNGCFRGFWEGEIGLKEVVRSFFEGRFKEGFELLKGYEQRMRLDYHLSAHVDALLALIKSHSLVAYFTPYSRISFARMSSAFGFSEDDIKGSVERLIRGREGEGSTLEARIDEIGGELVERKDLGGREEIFERSLAMGAKIGVKNQRLALRMKMIRSEILVKAAGKGGD